MGKTARHQRNARRELDRRYPELTAARAAATPPAGGWLRAIREALGMTTTDVAERLNVAPSSVTRFELSERAGRIQLDTLRRTADALGCDLVYLLVPRQPLEQVVDDRARELARRELQSLGHTMDLEAQGLSDLELREREQELAVEIKSQPGLWHVTRFGLSSTKITLCGCSRASPRRFEPNLLICGLARPHSGRVVVDWPA